MFKTPRIMICVTRQRTCERLIQEGRNLALQTGGELYVVHAIKNGENYLGNPNEGEALEYLFQVSKEVGAEINVLRSKNVVKTLVDFAKKQRITIMVVGTAPDTQQHNIIHNLQCLLPAIDFVVT